MADRITVQVTRYLPEESTRPSSQDYEIPLRKDWSILDGLNHIKDHVDGTLSYRWSCRMGICGTCVVQSTDSHVEHRETCLTPDERAGGLLAACVSRGRGELSLLI